MFQSAIAADPRLLHAEPPLELSVVIPTFNEAANVAKLLGLLDAALAGVVWEAIFVDDDSADGTADLIRAIGRRNSRVRVLQRIGRRGLSSAVVEGMMASCAPVLAVIDADLQHDEAILPQLLEAVRNGADVAVGSRYTGDGGVGEWDRQRHAASRSGTWLAQRILNTPLSDPMSGFFVLSRQVLNAALPRLSGGGFKILLDILTSVPGPLNVVELPYTFRTRAAGESKLDLMVTAEYLKLLADKAFGQIVPIRLILFLMVGGLGVAVHLSILAGLLLAGLVFASAQAGAVWAAMTFNFTLNNLFTYSDRRLSGGRFFTGLISFYAVCLIGAAANVGVGSYIYGAQQSWWLAGVAGAMIGAVWNFAASSALTWRR
ncbi:MAG: glycosyltransferase family 2 protein [Pseudomonadota bacterium]|nr:glycosyltransferase family 2 protein [Pseudomonadota bacterium]